MTELTAEQATMAAAYGRSAAAWGEGPSRVYDALADELVARSPIPLTGRVVADVGAGRGAASRAVARVGGRPLALDVAEGMLAAAPRHARVPCAVADSRSLPLGDGSVGAVVAAFSFNHLGDPTAGLAEAARVTARGGAVLASAYAADDDHPVKAAVEAAVRAAGWEPDAWVADVHRDAGRLATPEAALAAAEQAGLASPSAEVVVRPFPELTPEDLVAWRMGMAQVAPFLESLDPAARAHVAAAALERLGEAPVLVRRMVVVTAIVRPT